MIDRLEEVPDVHLPDDAGVLFVLSEPLLDVLLPLVRSTPWDGSQDEGAHAVADARLQCFDNDVVNDLLRIVVGLHDLALLVRAVVVNDMSVVLPWPVGLVDDHALDQLDVLLDVVQDPGDVLPVSLSSRGVQDRRPDYFLRDCCFVIDAEALHRFVSSFLSPRGRWPPGYWPAPVIGLIFTIVSRISAA